MDKKPESDSKAVEFEAYDGPDYQRPLLSHRKVPGLKSSKRTVPVQKIDRPQEVREVRVRAWTEV